MNESIIIVPPPDTTDFTIIYNDTKIPVSKYKLARTSPMFLSIDNFTNTTTLVRKGPIAVSIFRDFIAAAQGVPTELNAENVYGFLKLSDEWKINSLKEASIKYLSENPNISEMNAQLHDNEELYSEVLAKNFDTSLTFESLTNVPLEIIKKTINNRNFVLHEHNLYYKFVISMLSQYSEEANFLVQKIELRYLNPEQIQTILANPNINKSDLAESLAQTTIEVIKESEQMKEHIKQNDALIETLLKRIDDLEKLSHSAIQQAADAQKSVNALAIKLTEEMDKKDQEVEKSARKDLKKTNATVNSLTRKIIPIENNLQELPKLRNEFYTFVNDVGHRFDSILSQQNLQVIDDEEEEGLIIQFIKRKPFNGIFTHIRNVLGNTDSIEVTASSSEHNSPQQIIDFEWNDFWQSQNQPNQFIQFDFKDKRVMVTDYSIKTHKYSAGSCHLKQWILEGSESGEKWNLLDKQQTDDLNCSNKILTFNIQQPDPTLYRYVRLVQTGLNQREDNILAIANIELFGELYMP